MNNSAEIRIRQVMLAGGSIFIASAIALIARPDLFGEFIGITGLDAYWSLRMTGIVLIPLGYLMIVVRSVASNSVVKSFAYLNRNITCTWTSKYWAHNLCNYWIFVFHTLCCSNCSGAKQKLAF
jgi:hypothetical protein